MHLLSKLAGLALWLGWAVTLSTQQEPDTLFRPAGADPSSSSTAATPTFTLPTAGFVSLPNSWKDGFQVRGLAGDLDGAGLAGTNVLVVAKRSAAIRSSPRSRPGRSER